jgi:hypothetical protein
MFLIHLLFNNHMKNSNQFPRLCFSRLLIYALSLFGVLIFNSCKKETAEVKQGTYLGVVNASPTLATYNFYLNDSQANGAALPFGGTIKYLQLSPADYAAKFTSANSVESLLTKNVSLAANTIYTLFLISDNKTLDGLLVTDNISAINANAYVRFVNLSPDAPALDMAVTGATETLITNQSFKAASAFTAILLILKSIVQEQLRQH